MLNEEHLHFYQNYSVEHIVKNKHCGLLLDMGLGKTVTCLTAFNILQMVDVSNALVVAPKRVVESVWKQETEKWEHLKDLKVCRIIGNAKQREAAFKTKADIHLISCDNLMWLIGLCGGSKLPFGMLIIDESSKFKNPDAKRFKALRKTRLSFKRIVILTGTPAPNSLIDLWSQIYLLDGGERLGKFVTHYRNEYFTKGYTGFNYEPRKNAEKRIHNAIADICVSMKAKDYLKLPERVDNFVYIDLPATIKKRYEVFEKEMVLQLLEQIGDVEEVSAAHAAALSNKLLQFANGFVYDEDKNTHVIHDLKLRALEEILEANFLKPVMVFYTYKSDFQRIKKHLKGYKVVNVKERNAVDDWNAGKIDVLAMHPASGGHGLNLQQGGHIGVWFGQTWSLEMYQQANARFHRQGQTNACYFHHLVVRGSMDEEVIARLQRKDKSQNALLEAVKAKIEKYI